MKYTAHKEPSPIDPRTADATPPVRLLEGSSRSGQAVFERRLLASAAIDEIPPASLQRLAAAFDVAAVARPAPGLPSLGPRALRLGKAGSFVALGALAVLGGVVASGWFASPAPGPDRSSESAPTEPAEAPPIVLAPQPVRLLDSPAHEPSELVTPAPAPASTPARAVAPRERSAKPTVESTLSAQRREPRGLREELRRLEAVQNDLRAGRASDAARGLDGYARAFPRGELALEAELLEIDVSLARGDRARALARSQRMLARPGAERYRARLEAALNARVSVAAAAATESGVIRRSAHMKEVEVTR